MANLVRSTKSGSDWTTNDLLAYNIRVSSQSPDNFYDQPLQRSKASAASTPIYSLLPSYLDLASRANSGQESAIDDFAREILRTLGYEKRGLLLRSRYAIPLLINGDPKRSAQTGVCLVQGSSTILLVVQEDQTTVSVRDPEPQVIAEAIATFRCNNHIRARLGKPERNSMTIPCITMIGTRPIFYLVPVTRELSEAVATAQYPLSSTVVKKCVVASNSRRLSEGMETPAFQKVALQHYTAFRTLAEAHWSVFMVPLDMGA